MISEKPLASQYLKRRRDELRPYQEWVAQKIVEEKTVLLAIDMSLGKTVSTLTAIRDLFKQRKIKHVLVIAPLRVAQEVWPAEIEKWNHTQHLTYEVALGMAGQRRRAVNKRAQITIINRDNIVWLWKELQKFESPWIWDCIVWDESSALGEWRYWNQGTKKNPDARTMTRFNAFAKACKKAEYRVLLTGTPATRGCQSLGGQLFCVDFGERLGASKEKFLTRWFDEDPHSGAIEPRPGAFGVIMSKVADKMLALRAEDYLELPPLVPNPVYVDFPPELLKEYRRFERDMVSQTYDVEAVNRGVLTNKLLQYANGAMYRGAEDLEGRKVRNIVPVHDLKLQALDKLIAGAEGQPLMIAYAFKFDLARMRERYPKLVVFNEDRTAYKRWNDGNIDLMAVHPASAGHGLNFQYGGHMQVWFGFTWSLELFLQFNMRLTRPDQAHPFVVSHRIIARGTVDERVLGVMDQRGATQKMVTDAVKILPDDILARAA